MKTHSMSFKNFMRGISKDITKSNYTEWLRNDIMKFAYLQKTIFNPEEYGELMELDVVELDYKKEQRQN